MRRFRSLSVKAGLLLGSILATLLLCEAALRLFYPKFKYAAESDYRSSGTRIWMRNPNTRYVRLHPDTGRPHAVRHNNLGLRQHRDFSESSFLEATNVGVFGDSFVENLRLPAPYALTEPLDYLLNRSGRGFNVLNFGVDGYGTDQAYLAYREFPARQRLKHVFYFFCGNDVRNVHENRLFRVDEKRTLVGSPARKPSWAVRVLSKFHLTYLVVETIENTLFRTRDLNKRIDLASFLAHARNYHSAKANEIERSFQENRALPELTESLGIILEVLKTWRREVEANGGRFHVVLLPRMPEHNAGSFFREAGFPVIDLYEAVMGEFAGEIGGREIRFQKDAHWNELGNLVAALKLRAVIGESEGVSGVDGATIRRWIATYYAAFEGGWTPDAEWHDVVDNATERAAIRQKYAALE